MSLLMLDTNICIYIIRNKPTKVLEKFSQQEAGKLYISSICISELYHGAFKSQRIAQNIIALESFLSPLNIAQYDLEASIEYGKIRASLEKQGKVIGALDMLIAAHAKSINAIIITNNTKEFDRVSGLKVENWAV
ncbi:VapC toxin protein [uncultured Gammaproteobacteria bacterium]|nr:VapC toxin protein [uncultured Gammaproteobacteria bacterium]CAC9608521.1 VapC toxin protein [uncultured Gammaproteobacteria bacterium]CAC9613555.1 VapC toxin protein [uncultured Gammaproteobacteria bacterium]